jgi:hypothetical protein
MNAAHGAPPELAESPGITRPRAVALAIVVCLGAGRPMTAQELARTATVSERPPSTVSVLSWSADEAEGLVYITQPAPLAPARDSLANGAIAGAIVGAVGVGAFGAFICHLYRQRGGPGCLPDALRGAALGAAIGAGAGIAVDAALTRHAGVLVRVGLAF